MSVYIVLHYAPTFNGIFGGIDFSNGRGSMSSLADVARLIELGCRAEDPAVQAQGEFRLKEEAALRDKQAPKSELERLERLPDCDPRHRRRGLRHRLGRP